MLTGPPPKFRNLGHPLDAELRLLAAVGWSIREYGGEPESRQVDELLDGRLTVRAKRASVATGCNRSQDRSRRSHGST
jgi:hypothetical protein